MKTVEAAKAHGENDDQSDKTNASIDSSRSKASSDTNMDIFGASNDAQSAHLLPHATSCASYWFPVVPLVLSTGEELLSWKFLQKCIHGTSKRPKKVRWKQIQRIQVVDPRNPVNASLHMLESNISQPIGSDSKLKENTLTHRLA